MFVARTQRKGRVKRIRCGAEGAGGCADLLAGWELILFGTLLLMESNRVTCRGDDGQGGS